jgi:flagellar motor switch protein FliN/FliY
MSEEQQLPTNPEEEANLDPSTDAALPADDDAAAESTEAQADSSGASETLSADDIDALIAQQAAESGAQATADSGAETAASDAVDSEELGSADGTDPVSEAAGAPSSPGISQSDLDALLADAEAQLKQASDQAEAAAESADSGDGGTDDIMAEMAAAIEAEQAAAASEPASAPIDANPSVVGGGAGSKFPAQAATDVQLPSFDAAALADGLADIQLLDDVELNVKIELGRTEMYVEDVLQLGVGSVVELDKLAGDPVDIFVNEQLVARGEVLVLNDNFCVRLNELVSPMAPTEVEA